MHDDALRELIEHADKLEAVNAQLLEALEDVMRWFSKLEDWQGVGDPDTEKYRAAIDKATGGQK